MGVRGDEALFARIARGELIGGSQRFVSDTIIRLNQRPVMETGINGERYVLYGGPDGDWRSRSAAIIRYFERCHASRIRDESRGRD